MTRAEWLAVVFLAIVVAIGGSVYAEQVRYEEVGAP